jgi:hypothetical protein
MLGLAAPGQPARISEVSSDEVGVLQAGQWTDSVNRRHDDDANGLYACRDSIMHAVG